MVYIRKLFVFMFLNVIYYEYIILVYRICTQQCFLSFCRFGGRRRSSSVEKRGTAPPLYSSTGTGTGTVYTIMGVIAV